TERLQHPPASVPVPETILQTQHGSRFRGHPGELLLDHRDVVGMDVGEAGAPDQLFRSVAESALQRRALIEDSTLFVADAGDVVRVLDEGTEVLLPLPEDVLGCVPLRDVAYVEDETPARGVGNQRCTDSLQVPPAPVAVPEAAF